MSLQLSTAMLGNDPELETLRLYEKHHMAEALKAQTAYEWHSWQLKEIRKRLARAKHSNPEIPEDQTK